jgi:hypothetical protein
MKLLSKTLTVTALILPLASGLVACHSYEYIPADPPGPVKFETRQKQATTLKEFLGSEYASAFRNNTCEKSPVPAVTNDDFVIGAALVNNDRNCPFCIEHQIIRIYLTAEQGIRLVEISTSTHFSRKHENNHVTRDLDQRADGKDCKPQTIVVSEAYTKRTITNPQWAITDNQLVIKNSPLDITIKKEGNGFFVYSSEAEKTFKQSPQLSSSYPMELKLWTDGWPSNDMPYCPRLPKCDRSSEEQNKTLFRKLSAEKLSVKVDNSKSYLNFKVAPMGVLAHGMLYELDKMPVLPVESTICILIAPETSPNYASKTVMNINSVENITTDNYEGVNLEFGENIVLKCQRIDKKNISVLDVNEATKGTLRIQLK